MKILSVLIFILLSGFSFAATVDTVTIYSEAMHITKKCVVIKPNGYKRKSSEFPTVYLLHGYAGAYSDWIKKVPAIKNYSDEYHLLIVCPDGDFSSWYFDSPVDSSMKYETYISKEVPAFIDAHYKTIKERNARAITGLSMGGHGAFFIAFRHSDFFGACGSMSGGMDLKAVSTKFDISKRLGDTSNHAEYWKNYSVVGVVENRSSQPLAITFDCGVDDFFHEGNQKLHQELLQLKIPHDYTERPGNHSWDYWSNSIQYHLLFFKKYFDKSLNK